MLHTVNDANGERHPNAEVTAGVERFWLHTNSVLEKKIDLMTYPLI
jgi:hypothetical protein